MLLRKRSRVNCFVIYVVCLQLKFLVMSINFNDTFKAFTSHVFFLFLDVSQFWDFLLFLDCWFGWKKAEQRALKSSQERGV